MSVFFYRPVAHADLCHNKCRAVEHSKRIYSKSDTFQVRTHFHALGTDFQHLDILRLLRIPPKHSAQSHTKAANRIRHAHCAQSPHSIRTPGGGGAKNRTRFSFLSIHRGRVAMPPYITRVEMRAAAFGHRRGRDAHTHKTSIAYREINRPVVIADTKSTIHQTTLKWTLTGQPYDVRFN